MKKIILIFLSIPLIILAGCVSSRYTVHYFIKLFAEVEVPDNATVLFRKEKVLGLNGRSHHYFALEFHETASDFLDEHGFILGPDANFEKSFAWFQRVLTDLAVPDQYHPNWDETYYWLHTNGVYLMYFTENSLLLVLVVGH